MHTPKIIIIPAPNCLRSKRIIEFLDASAIPYRRIELDSTEGQAMATKHDFRSSPGILVDDVKVNPFDLLVQPGCRVNDEKAQSVFNLQKKQKISEKQGK
jgi:hypothetical protein